MITKEMVVRAARIFRDHENSGHRPGRGGHGQEKQGRPQLCKLCRRPEDAADVVQDTFARLCRENPQRLNSHLPQWLFPVCRNRALDIRKKEARGKMLDAAALRIDKTSRPNDRVEQRDFHANQRNRSRDPAQFGLTVDSVWSDRAA